ncbi:hypothetical protein M3Y95_00054700 [Aphelenchoides besseyi]|nr:hypothetical protein M3Y95_00054700 [Aphelenchoides besseyi]
MSEEVSERRNFYAWNIPFLPSPVQNMLQLIESANLHDTTTTSLAEQNIAPLINEIFGTVESGQVPSIPPLIAPSIMRNQDGETLLIVASRCGHAAVVDRFRNEIDVDETDIDGWTALLCAAHQGHADCVRLLLEANASIDQSDIMGWTSLMWACYKNRLEAVKVLLEYHAHVNIVGEEDGLTPLIIAAGRGYGDVVHVLLNSGAEVNSSDKFGSTALIWSARKGYTEIVEELLNAGAEVDAIGMYSSTALMLAARGCHRKVVELLLSREPNVNVVDYNGLSALGIAAREGYTEIAQALIHSGAYVNTVDRFGNSILASAVRSGNIHLIRMLLEKHADVNAKDSENRTPLHLAIDKSYTDIVLALLEKKPNLEQKNKDGDTSLLRAVKNRDIALCQLLVHSGAKISAVDNAGDNALHLALRARSKRLAQILLVNPGDSKLLYRPNKVGETPYSIDQESATPILPTIFGPIGIDADLKNLLGFEAYSDVLADIVCEPNLSLPLSIGLYAKWGSGKSFLLPKMRESMKSFSRSWLDGLELYWSWTLILICFVLCSVLSLLIVSLFTLIQASLSIFYPLVIGAIGFILLLSTYGFIYYGSEIRLWNSSIALARLIARSLARLKLVISVATLNAPIRTDKELIVSPVSFLFSDDHRLSFVGGDQALTNIVLSLFTAAEEHYGPVAVRLFAAFKGHTQTESKLRTLCGIPVLFFFILTFVSFFIALILLIKYIIGTEEMASVFLGFIAFTSIFLFCATVPLYLFVVKMLINIPQRRIKRISHRLHSIPFERLVQKLQKEVDLLTSLIHALDAFTNSQTRLVIMVDGLDSCEQNSMVQLLDAISLFFGSRQNVPYIVIIAADPHIIVSALQNNLRGTNVNYEITGHDYIKNIISMPFYLHHTALQQLQRRQNLTTQTANGGWLERRRSQSLRGSRLSLREKEGLNVASNQAAAKDNLVNSLMSSEFSQLFPSHDYFVNMNPRLMRRIVNSIALTGRLLRSFEVEFSWFLLYMWISLLEQWPFRMTFLVDCALDNVDDSMPIAELYERSKSHLPTKGTLTDLDRNPAEFDQIMKRLSTAKTEQLTIGHLKSFSPCTSNLDPYLKKLIREQIIEEHGQTNLNDERELFSFSQFEQHQLQNAQFLFDDSDIWSTIVRPLPKMSIGEICKLVERLNIANERISIITNSLVENNLNGLALQSCELDDLRQILQLPLGDWTLFKLFIEALRVWRPALNRSMDTTSLKTRTPKPLSEIRGSTNLISIHEEQPNGGSTIHDHIEDHKRDTPSPQGKLDTPELEENAYEDEDADSMRSLAGSRQSLLNKSPERRPKS